MTNETGTSSPGGGPAVALAAGARAGPPGGGALERGARAGPKKSRKLAKNSGKRGKSNVFFAKKWRKQVPPRPEAAPGEQEHAQTALAPWAGELQGVESDEESGHAGEVRCRALK